MNTTPRPRPVGRRIVLTGLSALALAPILAACGDDATAESSGGGAGAIDGGGGVVTAEPGAFPATLTHRFGETVIESAPQRVVCVGLIEQDALLALGVVPVGVSYWFGDEAKGGIYDWSRPAFDAIDGAEAPTMMKPADGIPVEEVARLAPDLILGLYSGMTQREFDLLSKIAPTVAQSGDYADYGMPWDETTLVIGTAIGRPGAAQTLVDDVRAQVAAAAEDNPGFAGRTAAVVTPYEGLGVYGPEDPRSRMLVELGFALPPIVADLDTDEFFLSLSVERTDELGDVGAVVWLGLDADAQVRRAFEGTTAFEDGRWLDISDADGDYYVAHSFVSPLSIPYVLERYVPQLAAAADGDPATQVPEPAA